MATEKIFLLIIGILFTAVGVYLLVKQLKNRKHNTEAVSAEIIGYHEELHHDGDMVDSYVYYPIVKYCVLGRWYEGKRDVGTNKKRYAIGEYVDVLYDPENPEHFSFAGDKTGLFLAIAAMVIGIGIVVLFFVSK